MAEPNNINGINPNPGMLEETIAGNQAMIFTATDKELIKNIGGKVDQERSFREIFAQKPLTEKVENEETKAFNEQDKRVVESRYNNHRQMMEESPYKGLKGKAQTAEENQEEEGSTEAETQTEAPKGSDQYIQHQTRALAKELKLDHEDLHKKFALSQNDLHNLICRIKDLHLKRLLCEAEKDFKELSEEIRAHTLAAARPEAKNWLEGQLHQLSLEAAKYKLNIAKSLQSVDFDIKRNRMIKWLEKSVRKLAR